MSETSFDNIGSSHQIGRDETAEVLSRDSFAPQAVTGVRRAIRYYIEEDNGGNLLLPKIDGRVALKSLREAFETLGEEIAVNSLEFKQTGSRQEANLIITSKRDLPGAKIAYADTTTDGRHRITFNCSKSFDKALFEATAAHAFEISFGYPIRRYEAIPNDPYIR